LITASAVTWALLGHFLELGGDYLKQSRPYVVEALVEPSVELHEHELGVVVSLFERTADELDHRRLADAPRTRDANRYWTPLSLLDYFSNRLGDACKIHKISAGDII
jgi:hypothetical protein